MPDDTPLSSSGVNPFRAPPQHVCWSCQMGHSGQPVSLTPDLLLPVCRTCWLKMSQFERITIAIQFHDRDDSSKPIRFQSDN